MKRLADPQATQDPVIATSRKYKGLLHCEPNDTTQLRERVTEFENTVRPLVNRALDAAYLFYDATRLLLYNNEFLWNKQLCLHFPLENKTIPSGDCYCLVLFDYAPGQQPVFTHVCPIDAAHWNQAPIVDGHYKAFHLTRDIVQLSLAEESDEIVHSQHCDHDSNHMIIDQEINNTNEVEITEPHTELTEQEANEMQKVRLLWIDETAHYWLVTPPSPTTRKLDEGAPHCFQQYLQLLVDVQLMTDARHMKHLCERATDIVKKQYNYYTGLIASAVRVNLSMLFMCTAVRAFQSHRKTQILEEATPDADLENADRLTTEDLIKMPIFDCWLDSEMHLFKQAPPHSKHEWLFATLLPRTVEFMHGRVPRALLPAWMEYTINKSTYDRTLPFSDRYWVQQHDTKLYKIRMEWLLKSEFTAWLSKPGTVQPKVRAGFVLIEKEIFDSMFLPCLYRQVLSGLIIWFYYSAVRETTEEDPFHLALAQYTTTDQAQVKEACTKLLSLNFGHSASIISFCHQYGDPLSPALQQYETLINTPKPEGRDALRGSFGACGGGGGGGGGQGNGLVQIRRDEVPDLEDLFVSDILPPCLKHIYSPENRNRLGNSDRLNGVRYLLSLGYSEEEILRGLNKDEVKKYGMELRSIVKSYSGKAQNNERGPLGCASVINLDAGTRNVFRCVYEKAQNGDERVHYATHEEKLPFINECCRTNFPPLTNGGYQKKMSHPLQYIRLKLDK